MSIFIIRGPEAAGALIRTAMPLPAPVLKSLVHRAIDAGTSVAIRACGHRAWLPRIFTRAG